MDEIDKVIKDFEQPAPLPQVVRQHLANRRGEAARRDRTDTVNGTAEQPAPRSPIAIRLPGKRPADTARPSGADQSGQGVAPPTAHSPIAIRLPVAKPRADTATATPVGKEAKPPTPRSPIATRIPASPEIDATQGYVARTDRRAATVARPTVRAQQLAHAIDAKEYYWLRKHGARPEHVRQAYLQMPELDSEEKRAFCLLRGIGLGRKDAYRHASTAAIPGFDGIPTLEARLAYGCLCAAGFNPDQSAEIIGQTRPGIADFFLEAATVRATDDDGAAKTNYCALRILQYRPRQARYWAHSGRASVTRMSSLGTLQKKYRTQAGCPLTPGNFPRFIGKSVPGSQAPLGAGAFNQVARLKIVDPRDGREREFAFKPSRPDPEVGLGGSLCGIADDAYFPESRNLATVAVARILGLSGERGIIGEAFMGIVDGRLGLLMELERGKPIATFDHQMTLDRNSFAYGHLTDSKTKHLLMTDRESNHAFANLLGVHSVRYSGEDVILTGSYALNQKPFRDNDSSLKQNYALVQLLLYLVNNGDCHPGNMITSVDAGGKYHVRLIDQDQTMGGISDPKLEPENSDMSYFLPMRPTHVSREVADRLCASKTRKLLEDALLQFELQDHERIAFFSRFESVVRDVQAGKITVVDDAKDVSVWSAVKMDNPATSLFARDGLRPGPSVRLSKPVLAAKVDVAIPILSKPGGNHVPNNRRRRTSPGS